MFGIDDAALAGILGGLISTAGKLYTNRENISAEEKANEINWEIARLNNATEVEMANTAHQREIADLRAAGLNPILSAGGNGSSTPSLATPTLNPVHTDNELFDGLANSASGLSRYFGEKYQADLANTIQRNNLLDAANQGMKIENDKAHLDYEIDHPKQQSEYMKNLIENVATQEETGTDVFWDPKKNVYQVSIQDPDRVRKAVELAREGIRSDLKTRANANLRANISTGASAVNSAASLLNASGRFGKAR